MRNTTLPTSGSRHQHTRKPDVLVGILYYTQCLISPYRPNQIYPSVQEFYKMFNLLVERFTSTNTTPINKKLSNTYIKVNTNLRGP